MLSHGSGSTATARKVPGVFLLAALLAAALGVASAGPIGEQVVRGDVALQRQDGLTTITASHNSIINYQSFNIGAAETVRFIQPGATARVLNRILTPSPTQIDGQLLANGHIYLINPAGIYFGQNAFVDVGGIHAAAGHMSDGDFLAGMDRFTALAGEVANRGTIIGNSIALVGSRVANYGSITAEQGTVIMAAGEDVYIGRRDGRIFVKIEGGAPSGDAPRVENAGTMQAEGGAAVLGAGDAYSLAIRTTGVLKAADVTVEGQGKGAVQVGGTVDASNPSGQGGSVKLLGEQVGLVGATVDASGATGGGTILVGGNYQGSGPERNSLFTYVGADSVLRADARLSGNGGRVIVWSDGSTGFYGSLSARGGALGGNGGFAEVSGKAYLQFAGTADLRAPAGVVGSILLDPTDIFIGGADSPTLVFVPGIGAPPPPPPPYPPTPPGYTITDVGAAASNISTATLALLLSGADVTISTSSPGPALGIITVGVPFDPPAGYVTPFRLTLNADNTIAVGFPLINGGAGSVTMNAPTVNIAIAAPVTLTGGGLAITTDNLTASAPVSAPGGITIAPFTPGQGFALNAAGPPPAGDLSPLTLNNLFTAGGTVSIGDANTGAITVNPGPIATDWGGLTLRGTSVTFTGQLTLPSNATMTFDQVAGAITGSGVGMDIVIPGGAGTLVFNNVGGAANLMTTVNQLSASTVSGLTLNNSTNTLTVTGALVSNNQPISIDAGSFTNNVGATINAGTSTFALRTDNVSIGATITGDSGITIAPQSGGTSVGLNGAGGTLNLTLAELGLLSSNGGTVTLGSTAAGAVNVGTGDLSGRNWAGLTLHGASVAFSGQLTLPNDALMTFGTVAGSITGSGGTDLVVGGATGTLAFTNVGGSASLITDVDQLAASAVAGLTLDNGNNSLTLTGGLDSSSQPISISVGTGTFTNNAGATVNAGTSTFTLSADDASIGATITANGGITIYTATGGRKICLESPGASLSLGATELGFLSSTTGVTIGRNDSASDIDIAKSAAIGSPTPLAYNLALIGDKYDQPTNTVSVGANALTLQVDTITNLSTTLTANGGITIAPRTANRTIAVGDNATGNLAISEAQIETYLVSSTGLTIGSLAAGNLDVQDNQTLTFPYLTTLRTGGNLTFDSAITASNGLAATATGTITIGSGNKLTVSAGNLNFAAGGNIAINAAIDPPAQVLIDSDNDINVAAAITADDLIRLRAGQDGTGSVNVNAGGSLATDNLANNSAIWLEAGTSGGTSGNIAFGGGNVTTEDLLTVISHKGTINRTAGSVTAGRAYLYGDTGISIATLNVAALDAVTNGLVGSDISITDTAGGLIARDIAGTSVGVNAGAANVSLTVQNGSLTSASSDGSTADVVGNTVTLAVTGAGSTIGTGTATRLQLNAATLNATTNGSAGDDIFILDTAGGLVVGSGAAVTGGVKAGSGNVDLRVLAGSLTGTSTNETTADVVGNIVTLAVTDPAVIPPCSTIGTGPADGSRLQLNAATLNASTSGAVAGDNIYILDTAGGLAIGDGTTGGVMAGLGMVNLKVMSGSLSSSTVDGTPDVVGDGVVLRVTGAGNTIGAGSGSRLEINAVSLQAYTNGAAGDDIFILDTAGGLTTPAIGASPSGNIDIRVLGGPFTSQIIDGTADLAGNVVTLAVTGAGSTIGTNAASRMELNAATLNLSTNGAVGDDIFILDVAGGLTTGTISAGSANVDLSVAGGSLTIGSKITMSGGILTLAAATGVGTLSVNINAAIDPPAQVLVDANDDINVTAAVNADNLIRLRAGLDGSGSVNLSGAGALTTNLAGSDVLLSAGAGSGGIAFGGGSVTAVDLLSADAPAGLVNLTAGSLAAARAYLRGATGITNLSVDFGALDAVTTNATISITDTLGGLAIGDTLGANVGVNAGAGTVTLSVNNGSLTSSTVDLLPDVVGSTVTLNASGVVLSNIGAGPGIPLEVDATTLVATTTGVPPHGIFLLDTATGFTVGATGITSSGGPIEILINPLGPPGPIFLGGDINAGAGTLTLGSPGPLPIPPFPPPIPVQLIVPDTSTARALTGATVTLHGQLSLGSTGASPSETLTINGNFAFGAGGALIAQIGSAAASNDQLIVNGTVTLNNAMLIPSLAFPASPPPANTPFTLVDNRPPIEPAPDPIAGLFNDVTNVPIPEGGIVNLSGRPFVASYVGGDGNDFTLTSQAITSIWDGGGVANNWSDPINWVGDIAIAVGDALVFPGVGVDPTSLSNTNDVGAAFASFTFTGGGYTLGGTGVTLSSSGNAISNTVGSNIVDMDLTVGTAQTFDVSGGVLTLNAGRTVAVSNPLTLNAAGLTTLNVNGTANLNASLTLAGAGTIVTGAASAIEGPGGLTINMPGGTATFNGTVGATTTLGSLTIAAQPFNVAFNGTTNTIDGATSFLNTGTVTLGDGAGDTCNFTGGVDTSGGPSLTNLAGNLNTTTGSINLGATTLIADATLSSGAVTFAGTLDSDPTPRALVVNTSGGGLTAFLGPVGLGANLAYDGGGVDDRPLSSLTTNGDGRTDLNAGVVFTTGLQNYNDPVVLTLDTTLYASGVTFAGTVDSDALATPRSLVVNTSGGGVTAFFWPVGLGANATYDGGAGDDRPLASLTTNADGGTDLVGGVVFTTGLQTYNDPVVLYQNTTLYGSGVTFAGRVDSDALATPRSLVVNTSGGGVTAFQALVGLGANGLYEGGAGDDRPLASLTTNADGRTDLNAGVVFTTGVQTYNDPVVLTLDTTLYGSSVTFGGTVDSDALATPRSLVVNTSGGGLTAFLGPVGLGANLAYDGGVGDDRPLSSLTTDADGRTDLNAGVVFTTGVQNYNDAVVLTLDTTLYASGVTFAGTVDSDALGTPRSLAVNTSGGGVTAFLGPVGLGANATYDGGAGDDRPLASLTTNADGGTDLNGGVVFTTGLQTYNDAVVLFQNTTLYGSGVTFAGRVDSDALGTPRSLVVNTSGGGVTAFQALVGLGANGLYDGGAGDDRPLASLTTNADGRTDLNGGVVFTTGVQTYNDPVVLTQNTTLYGGGVTFAGTLDSNALATPRSLAVNTSGGGLTAFLGLVGLGANGTYDGGAGDDQPLSSLTTNGDGRTDLNAGVVFTTGLQNYHDPVVLTLDTTLYASGVTFAGTVDSDALGTPRSLAVNTSGGGVTAFLGPVGLGANAAYDGGAGDDLPLASLTTNADGGTDLNGGVVFTTGLQTYNDAVILFQNTTLYGSGVTFAGRLDSDALATPRSLVVNTSGSGVTTFQGLVGLGANGLYNGGAGDDRPLASLTTNADGRTDLNGGMVFTAGTQTYNDAVTLGVNTTLIGATAIDFGSTLDGSRNLLVNAGGGTTTFTGAVGSGVGTKLGTGTGYAIDVQSSSATEFQSTVEANSGIRVTGPVIFRQDVTLGNGDTGTNLTGTVQLDGLTFSGFDGLTFGATTLSGGPVTLNSNGSAIQINTLTGAQNLTLAAGIGGGATTVTGAVTNLGTGTGAALTIENGVTGLVYFQNTVGANSGLVAQTTTSNVRFDGDVTLGDGDTGTSLPGAVQLDGLTFSGFDGLTLGTVTLSTAGVTLASNGGNALLGPVNGAQILTVASGAGTTTFSAPVGAGTPLVALVTDVGGVTQINGGSVTTTGIQLYGDPVTLNAAGNATALTGGTVVFGSTLRSATDGQEALATNCTGAALFNAPVGDGGLRLASLTTNGTGVAIIGGGSVNTTGAQTYNTAVLLTGNTTLDAASVLFNANLDTAGYAPSLSGTPGGPAYNFQDISGTGTLVVFGGNQDDQLTAALPLFPFTFFGTPYASYYICSNGFVTFLAGQSAVWTPPPIPSAASPNGLAAGWWTDLHPGLGGTVRYQTLGAPGSRTEIVQYTGVPHFGGGPPATFQIALLEGSNAIEVHYLNPASDWVRQHVVGVENATGVAGVQVYNAIAPLPPSSAVRFTPVAAPADLTVNIAGAGLTRLSNVGTASRLGDLTVNTVGNIELNSTIRTAGNVLLGFGSPLPAIPNVATIYRGTAGNVDIATNGGNFAVGDLHKLTVASGNLIINATGAGNITLGDATAAGGINLTCNTLTLLQHAPTPGGILLSTGQFEGDHGTDLVAENGTFTFAVGSIVLQPVGTPQYGVMFGSSVTPANPTLLQITNIPGNTPLPPGVSSAWSGHTLRPLFGPANQVLDDRPNGYSPNYLAEALATAIPSEPPSRPVTQQVVLSPALRELLEQLGIFARDLTAVEQNLLAVGLPVAYDDTVKTDEPQHSDYTVAAARLPDDLVQATVGTYRRVFEKEGKYQDTEARGLLQKAFDAYKATVKEEVDPLAFRQFVEKTPEQKAALDLMNELRTLFAQIANLGLTDIQIRNAEQLVVRGITPTGLTPEQLVRAIKGAAAEGVKKTMQTQVRLAPAAPSNLGRRVAAAR